ncbi:MAG: BREX-2 system adenine-specific DNA-methyltransferase PglX [Aliidongia sp.]
MVDAKQLLADLKKVRKRLEADLRLYHQDSANRASVEAEWQEAFNAKRTADTFETFWTAALDQAAVHWILALVFLRFLEDNRLVDRPLLSGAGERLELAEERQRGYFRTHPQDSDDAFLLATFREIAALPGLTGLYDPAHNPLFRLPVSGDGAMALLAFFRERMPETGALLRDFTDPEWGTRFLGDLYQDLSEDARKRFALLQTPDFVETWILDRTLDPAMREFGATEVRMIDPTCGSGHFLLGGFARILAAWQRAAPEMPPAAQAQRALDAVAGVDLNPFAVEIARFRLLLAALQAAGETRLAAAPDFRFQLAVGDSLLHGRHYGQQGDFAETLDVGFQRRLRHHYAAEDNAAIETILGQQYHAVVGNPPYITPKDPAMRDAYREIYTSCHRTYGLGAPFIERFFELAQSGTSALTAGFIGLIVANSFMKREFGAKLIEEVLPHIDLTHIVDCSGAYIPGHGTPTAILFGRNRAPISGLVRTARGIRGEPGTPDQPALGLVWSAIVTQVDLVGSTSAFVSVEDTPRTVLSAHPWNMGGGGAAEVQNAIEQGASGQLGEVTTSIGFYQDTHADEAFIQPTSFFKRYDLLNYARPQIRGDDCRNWTFSADESILFPYDSDLKQLESLPNIPPFGWFWSLRTTLWNRTTFGGGTYQTAGRPWYDFHQFPIARARIPFTIAFGFVVTHNHFIFDRGGKVFNRSAPVIKLPAGASEDDHLGLLGLLNSSTACFWLKQISHNKGSTVDNKGARQRTDPFEDFYEFTSTGLQSFPIVGKLPIDLVHSLNAEAVSVSANLPATICGRVVPTSDALNTARLACEVARSTMIALQEELDWRCYQLYGLADDAPAYPTPPPLHLGERAFEIVMARRMAAGTFETAWFSRHSSTPIANLPAHWPADYRSIVERRIALIETDSTIGLIEQPEFKRRWEFEPWEVMERDALRLWLLDRLESRHFWPAAEPRLTSTGVLADAARHDADFLAVAALYAGEAVNLDALVAELVVAESVPFLPVMRYSESGLRKRADWEATWTKQREEDAIDAELAARRADFLRAAWTRANSRADDEGEQDYAARLATGLDDESVGAAADRAIATEAARRKHEEIGPIAVPPKYKSVDFLSQDFWRLRGGLDVPKERFVSFPHAVRDADGSLPVLWVGFDTSARARAIAGWYVARKDEDGWAGPRLIPLLAGLLELVPWLRQWHNDLDRETGVHMGDYFAAFVADEARELSLTLADLRGWTPPAPVRRRGGRRAAP